MQKELLAASLLMFMIIYAYQARGNGGGGGKTTGSGSGTKDSGGSGSGTDWSFDAVGPAEVFMMSLIFTLSVQFMTIIPVIGDSIYLMASFWCLALIGIFGRVFKAAKIDPPEVIFGTVGVVILAQIARLLPVVDSLYVFLYIFVGGGGSS